MVMKSGLRFTHHTEERGCNGKSKARAELGLIKRAQQLVMTFRRKDESRHLVSLTNDKVDTQKCLGNESACGFLNLQYQAFNRDNGMDQNVTASLDI